jgi:uncharacterized protein YcbX
MATLSGITLYPIKSCAGIALRAATLTRTGLTIGATSVSTTRSISDREWMVVDAAGHFLSQREYPRMALIVPRLHAPGAQTLAAGRSIETMPADARLMVSAPGMPMLEIELASPAPLAAPLMVQIWDDCVPARDCGAAAAAWFSAAIGTACRLVRASTLRAASEKWTGGVVASTRFADGYPVLVIASASLIDLNEKLVVAGRAALTMDRFRPNLVFDAMAAFDEDVAESFGLGQMLLTPVKPCPRCTIPSVDQATGQVGPDPQDVLRSYRTKPELDGAICFGMNCIVTQGEVQQIEVGQHVGVTLAF